MMNAEFVMRDGRVLARIINLAHRFNCGYSAIDVRPSNGAFAARIDFTGAADALRRFEAQLNKLLETEKEIYS